MEARRMLYQKPIRRKQREGVDTDDIFDISKASSVPTYLRERE
jgi:hypothetical protein